MLKGGKILLGYQADFRKWMGEKIHWSPPGGSLLVNLESQNNPYLLQYFLLLEIPIRSTARGDLKDQDDHFICFDRIYDTPVAPGRTTPKGNKKKLD